MGKVRNKSTPYGQSVESLHYNLTYIGMLTPAATELFGGGRMPP